MLNSNTWNHLTVCKEMSSDSFKNDVTCKLFAYKSLSHPHLQDLALKKLSRVDMLLKQIT